MQFSPKLKTAMEEIKAILQKHDIAGYVVIHTPGFSEYLNHLDTSYSCAKAESGGISVRINTNEVGKLKAKQLAEDTYNMITHFNDNLMNHVLTYNSTYNSLTEKWNGSRNNGGGHSSHSQQNN